MTLREYLYWKRIRQVDVCNELKLLHGTLGNIVRGKPCSRELAERLSAWTKGEVSVQSIKEGDLTIDRCETCGHLKKQIRLVK